jgi:predicted permease
MSRRLRQLLDRVRAAIARRRPDDDLDEEMADYLARAAERRVAAGERPDEATRLARAELGSPPAIRDHVRDLSPGTVLATIWQDVRYGVRLMARSRAFTLVATLVLSLGIGVNTALFSIVNALFFAPLAVDSPEELVYIYTLRPNGQADPVRRDAIDGFARLGAGLASFTSSGAAPMTLSWEGDTRAARGEIVDGQYFDLLGVRTSIGRPLGPFDDDPSATEPAMVISHELWTRWFGADPAALGQKVRLSRYEATMFTIVGVAAPGFRGVSDPWAPAQYWVTRAHTDAQASAGRIVARLKPGTTVDEFRAFVETATAILKDQAHRTRLTTDPRRPRLASQMIDQMRFVVYPALEVRTPSDPTATLMPKALIAALGIVVALVLLIATANIAGLLLARGVTRAGELAIRRALGADGRRLARQLLTESVLLAILGGVIGLGVAWNLLAVFRATTPSTFVLDVPLDWRVLVFAALVALGTGVLVGLVPAIQAARANVLAALGTSVASARHTRARLRHGIVIPQVGLSLVLLVVAAVHLRSLMRIEQTDLGYATEGGLVVRARLGGSPPPASRMTMPDEARKDLDARMRARAGGFAQTVLDRVGAAGAVDSVALTVGLPFRPYYSMSPYHVVGHGGAEAVEAAQTRISGEYFDVMRIPFLAGRTFDSRDLPGSRKVAIISHSLARRLWPSGEAVGKTVEFEMDPALTARGIRSVRLLDSFEVIGVVRDVTPVLGTPGDRPLLYLSALQPADNWIPLFYANQPATLVVRGAGDRAALIQRVKAAVVGADAFADVLGIQTPEQIVGEILYPQRVGAGVLVAAGLVGLMLASLGLYGLLSYSVAQRRREIGIRATLGAEPRALIGLVLREGARVIAIGGVVGLVIAAIVVRLTAGLVPGLPHVDMIALTAVPVLLALVILAACYVPARRAARVDPVDVLRAA